MPPTPPPARLGFAVGAPDAAPLAWAESPHLGQRLAAFREVLVGDLTLDEDRTAATAVLAPPDRAFDLAVALAELGWPQRLRFAFVSAPPAGAAAREDAVRAKARSRLDRLDRGSVLWCELHGRSDDECRLAAGLARLHQVLLLEMTPARRRAWLAFRRHGRQKPVAEELGVSQQAVSQMLNGAHFRDLLAAEASFRDWLRERRIAALWPLRRRTGS